MCFIFLYVNNPFKYINVKSSKSMKKIISLFVIIFIASYSSECILAKRTNTRKKSKVNEERLFMSAERTVCKTKEGETVRIKCVNTIKPVMVVTVYGAQLTEPDENDYDKQEIMVLTLDNGVEYTSNWWLTYDRYTRSMIELEYDLIQDLKKHAVVNIYIANKYEELEYDINPKTWKTAFNQCYREMPNKQED